MTFIERNGALIPLSRIFPNRYNPNEMSVDKRLQLRKEVEQDTYDPIIVSQAYVFYGEEAYTMNIEWKGRKCWEPEEAYIICDGFHRFQEADYLKLPEIRCEIWEMAEDEAMPYFWKRHNFKGVHDPIKEAILFQSDMIRNKLTRQELIEKYNLPGLSYLRKRLQSLRITSDVADIFYEPLEDAKTNLSFSHLVELTSLPREYQLAMAKITCEKGWTSPELRQQIIAFKKLRGTFNERLSQIMRDVYEKKRDETLVRATPLTDEEIEKIIEEAKADTENENKTIRQNITEKPAPPPILPPTEQDPPDESKEEEKQEPSTPYTPKTLAPPTTWRNNSRTPLPPIKIETANPPTEHLTVPPPTTITQDTRAKLDNFLDLLEEDLTTLEIYPQETHHLVLQEVKKQADIARFAPDKLETTKKIALLAAKAYILGDV